MWDYYPPKPGQWAVTTNRGKARYITCYTQEGKLLVLNWDNIESLEVVDVPETGGLTRVHLTSGKDAVIQASVADLWNAINQESGR